MRHSGRYASSSLEGNVVGGEFDGLHGRGFVATRQEFDRVQIRFTRIPRLRCDTHTDGDLLRDEKLGLIETMPGLFLLRAGGSSRRATELMEGGRLAELIAALQRLFDVVILDTPPAGVFPDAVALSHSCHELVYICRFDTVSRQAVRDVLQRLRKTGLEFPGVVLNAMPAGIGGSYYYRAYSYRDTKRYAKRYREQAE